MTFSNVIFDNNLMGVMMRKNFAQILQEANIDIRKEYSRLYSMLYDASDSEPSLYDEFCEHFGDFWFRGTATSLPDFDEQYGFNYVESPQDFSLDYLVSFCEYFYNLCIAYNAQRDFMCLSVEPFMQQINRVISNIGYTQSLKDGLTIFVEKSNEAIAVAEILPKELSYKVISYNHHSMKGNVAQKKDILLKLANLLEAERRKLSSINSTLEDNLFYAFNNLNIRHSNIDVNSPKYKKYVDEMPIDELEQWYDELYQMCLLAFLEIDNLERKKRFNELKNQIESTR